MKPENEGKERLSSEDRRAQIIDTALTLFAEKGFARTRTREIADAAGISETLIFQHFKTKDGLIRAALAALFHPHPVTGEIMTRLEREDDDAAFFGMIARHFIKHNREDPRIMKLALYSTLEGGHFGELTHADESLPSMLNMITEHIQKRIDTGAFVNTRAEIAARLFVETIFMYITDRMAGITGPPPTYSDDDVVDTLVSIFLNGLVKK